MFHPQISAKPAFVVVGFEAPFISALSPDATNLEVIGPLWNRLLQQANDIPNRVGGEMYGVIYGRPEKKRAHSQEFQYVAGVPVRSTTRFPDGMVSRKVGAGTFAVFTHRGPINTIGDTVHDIYRIWLPESDYEHAGIADVELYDQRFCHDSNDSEMEYWISVVPKASCQ